MEPVNTIMRNMLNVSIRKSDGGGSCSKMHDKNCKMWQSGERQQCQITGFFRHIQKRDKWKYNVLVRCDGKRDVSYKYKYSVNLFYL